MENAKNMVLADAIETAIKETRKNLRYRKIIMVQSIIILVLLLIIILGG